MKQYSLLLFFLMAGSAFASGMMKDLREQQPTYFPSVKRYIEVQAIDIYQSPIKHLILTGNLPKRIRPGKALKPLTFHYDWDDNTRDFLNLTFRRAASDSPVLIKWVLNIFSLKGQLFYGENEWGKSCDLPLEFLFDTGWLCCIHGSLTPAPIRYIYKGQTRFLEFDFGWKIAEPMTCTAVKRREPTLDVNTIFPFREKVPTSTTEIQLWVNIPQDDHWLTYQTQLAWVDNALNFRNFTCTFRKKKPDSCRGVLELSQGYSFLLKSGNYRKNTYFTSDAVLFFFDSKTKIFKWKDISTKKSRQILALCPPLLNDESGNMIKVNRITFDINGRQDQTTEIFEPIYKQNGISCSATNVNFK